MAAMDVDEILGSLGYCRAYQVLVYLSLAFVYMRGAWQVFAVMFIGADPGHHCHLPEVTNTSLPAYPDGNCKLLVDKGGHNVTTACTYGYTYGDEFDSTILSEFDLVCDKDYLVDLSTTIYMVGNAIGAVVITPMSDRFGRKHVLLVCLMVQGALGTGVAFVNSFPLFTSLRFFVGCLNMPIALIAYVMVAELFPTSRRTRPSVGLTFAWAAGIMSLSLFGYLVRGWRHLELLISLPNFLTIMFIWTLPESIPWLVSQRRYQQLRRTLMCISRMNRISLPSDLEQQFDNVQQAEEVHPPSGQTDHSEIGAVTQSQTPLTSGDVAAKKYTMLDLFRTPRIRRYTFIMFYLWLVNSLGYFGILFSTPSLHGNMFINLAISGAVEIPACALCIFVLERVGRRRPLIVFMLVCGVMNIATIIIPNKTESGVDLNPLIVTFAMIGKFGISGSYSTVYLMSAEIFPTVVRNQALGLSSFFENVGSIAAPFIVYGAKNLQTMPLVLFGILTLIGGILALFLPETHKHALPETIEEVEGLGKPSAQDQPEFSPSERL